MAGNNARGSLWRKWDLHVHTPHSVLNNGFGNDFRAYAAMLLRKAVDEGIAAIGITDYFSLDGYEALTELVADARRLEALLGPDYAAAAQQLLLLPNIELRTRDVIRDAHGKEARINLHVLFDETLTAAEIREHFLHRLHFAARAAPDEVDEDHELTAANLTALGARLKLEHSRFDSRPDIAVGMEQATVAHKEVTEVLQKHARRFRGKHLIAVAADEDLPGLSWDGQGHQTRKLLLQKSHFFFSASPTTRAFGLGDKHESPEAFVAEFGSLKACVHGSDAHRPEDVFRPAQGRQLWIKADTTFAGLRQLVHEPRDRCYIGVEPPALARANKSATRVLDEIELSRVPGARTPEKWFGGTVALNSGLVALIGRKGSGKSALADIIGMVGNSYAKPDFTFLAPARFLQRKSGLGSQFQAVGTWRNGDKTGGKLDREPNSDAPERVQYLPQTRLETICNMRASGDGPTEFDTELAGVIFSHVSEADRLGHNTLESLLAYQTSEVQKQIRTRETRIADLNSEIVELSEQATDSARRQLEAALAQRRSELSAHAAAEPRVPAPPQPDERDRDGALTTSLETTVSEIEQLDSALELAERSLTQEKQRSAAARRLLTRIDSLRDAVERFFTESDEDANHCDVELRAVVELRIDASAFSKAASDADAAASEYQRSLDPDIDGSLRSRRRAASAHAAALRERLNAPNREYQDAVRRHRVWARERDEITGELEDPNSIQALIGRLDRLQRLPQAIERLEAERATVARSIFEAKRGLVATYETLYAPVQRFIHEHPVAKQTDALDFAAAIVVDGLVDGFLSYIHHGRRGRFQGEKDGRQQLRDAIDDADFSTAESALAFCDSLISTLRGDGADPTVAQQLRSGASETDVLDFVYGLGFLAPRFQLRWQDKTLEQLSPGERGTLLLIFFLLIDQRDTPLIIDQPEENLDNETVATLLVPAIRAARDRRQVIIVTHNPNLAVVCDADQIVLATLDRGHGNEVRYASGAIENPEMTTAIVNVLEGTKPAFDMRDAKYESVL